MDKSKILSATLICVGFLLLGLCIKTGLGTIANSDRQVTVKGLCEREVDANLVTWPIVTKELGNDLPSIYNKIQANNGKIIKFLKDNGLSESEFAINPPSVQDLEANAYTSDESKKGRYLVTNVIVVNSSQVDLVNQLINKQDQLMRDGIAVVAGDYQYQTTYEFTGLNEIKPEMITEATAAAREAAIRLANDSQSELGKIITASQGQFSINDRDQYTPYKKTIRVVTSITYELKD